MESLGVVQALKDDPALHSLFAGGPPAALTSTEMKNLFEVPYSVPGSSKRQAEEMTVGYFRDWLSDVEGIYHIAVTKGATA